MDGGGLMLSVRNILTGLAFALTAYLAVRGLWWWGRSVASPMLVIAMVLLYLAGTFLCLLVGSRRVERQPPVEEPGSARRPERLPLGAAIFALAVALVVPTGISVGVGADVRTEGFATWYIGGVGALMMIVMVRRRPWFAWIGMAMLTVACWVWIDLLPALALGLVGSFVWVITAQLLVGAIGRAASDTSQLAELQQAASAWQAAQAGRQRERRVQVQRALAIAGPVLTRVVRSAGHLDEEGRAAARLAEGRLRDELRSPRLLDDGVRAALEAARRRGAVVTVLDEGGLDGLDVPSLRIIRAELAEAIRSSVSPRLYIRTAPHDRIAVTVVGRQEATGALSDDDNVDLWREIPYPQGSTRD